MLAALPSGVQFWTAGSIGLIWERRLSRVSRIPDNAGTIYAGLDAVFPGDGSEGTRSVEALSYIVLTHQAHTKQEFFRDVARFVIPLDPISQGEAAQLLLLRLEFQPLDHSLEGRWF